MFELTGGLLKQARTPGPTLLEKVGSLGSRYTLTLNIPEP